MSGAGSALSAAPSSGARGWVLGGIAAAAACAWWASASRRARCDDAAVAARDAQMAKGFSVCSGAAFQANNPGWMKPILAWVRDGVPEEHRVPADQRPPSLDDYLRKYAEEAGEADPEATLRFGAVMRRHHFMLDPRLRYLNHGSYGAALRCAYDTRAFYQRRLELGPVGFMELELLPAMAEALRHVSGFLGAAPEDLAFVTNATTGMSNIARSFPLRRGDAVLAFDVSYPAVLSILGRECAAAGADLVRVNVPFPYSADALVDRVTAALDANPHVTLACIDHVTSLPAVVVPIERIARLCKKRGIHVAVDGAHCVGGLELNMSRLEAAGVDAYTANFHKWLCTPKGSAFLWVSKPFQATVRPSVMSHGYSLGFIAEHFWQGTNDYAAHLAVPIAIDFFRRVGVERIMEHNQQLLDWGASMLARTWGTEVKYGVSDASTMLVIRLPDGAYGPDAASASALNRALRAVHKVEVPVFPAQGHLWIRLSAQMYNVEDEYTALAEGVAALQASDRR